MSVATPWRGPSSIDEHNFARDTRITSANAQRRTNPACPDDPDLHDDS